MLLPEKKLTKTQSEVFEWIESILFALVVVVLIFTFVVRAVQVQGSSMVPTLENGDKVILWSVNYTPTDGDIVVITDNNGFNTPLIKRVIATEGQTIDIDVDTGEVTVDGVVLNEPYIAEITRTAGDAYIYPVTVPEDKVFCMGDNRNASTDSRFSMVGMIDEEDIMGKVLFRYYPINKLGGLY